MSGWYLIYNGQQIGPMTKENILAYNPTKDTMVWKDGMENWQPIYTIPDLMSLLAMGQNNPPYTPAQLSAHDNPPTTPAGTYSDKSKTTAGILAILLGGLGIQYFYLGRAGAGFLTILLSLITCGIWPWLMIVQGIMMLTMSDAEFDRKYVFSHKTLPLF